jgi:hypothetical protein
LVSPVFHKGFSLHGIHAINRWIDINRIVSFISGRYFLKDCTIPTPEGVRLTWLHEHLVTGMQNTGDTLEINCKLTP